MMKALYRAGAVGVACAVTTGSMIAGTGMTFAKSPTQVIQFLNVGANPQTMQYFQSTVIPQFEKKYPNVQVQMQTVDWGTSFTKITTGIAGGTAPDVFIMGGIWLGPMVAQHALLPLNKYIKHWSEQKQYVPGAWKDGRLKATQYAIPFSLDARGLIVRTDLLQQAGIKVPTTWAQYMNAAKRLRVMSGSNIKQEGADWGIDDSVGLQQAFSQLFLQAGGQYFNAKGNKAEFDSPAGHTALQYLLTFYKQQLSSASVKTVGSAPPPVATGQAAMEFGNTGAITAATTYAPQIAPQLKMVTPLKFTGGSTPRGLLFVNKLGIYSKTKYPQAAWEWVQYISQPQVLSKWNQVLGALPPLFTLEKQAPWNSGPALDSLKVANYDVPQPSNPAMFSVIHIINDSISQAIYGKLTVNQTLQQIDQQIDQAIAQAALTK